MYLRLWSLVLRRGFLIQCAIPVPTQPSKWSESHETLCNFTCNWFQQPLARTNQKPKYTQNAVSLVRANSWLNSSRVSCGFNKVFRLPQNINDEYNNYPNYSTHRLYFGEVETLYNININWLTNCIHSPVLDKIVIAYK